MLVGLGWEHGCFSSWAIFLLLGAAIGSSAHFASAFHSASLRLVSRAAPPSQLNQPRAEQLSWGGRAKHHWFAINWFPPTKHHSYLIHKFTVSLLRL